MPRKKIEKRFHFLYKTTNLLNGKFYVGMHSTDDMDDGYLGSGKRLKYSIKKYGAVNFKREVLEFFENRNALVEREEKLVDEKLIQEPLCMNLRKGGEGGFTKEQSHKGRLSTNKILHERLQNDPEYRKKVIAAMSKGLSGKDNGKWTGKNHKESTKMLMSEKASRRIGNKNSQFGTCWIFKDTNNKKIKVEDLQQWLMLGWSKGRYIAG